MYRKLSKTFYHSSWQHLGKLTRYGIFCDAASMFIYFHSSRMKSQVVGNVRSDEIEHKYGVSQSLILGPLIFIFICNYLPSYVNTQPELYPDSTTFLNSCSEFENFPNLTMNT